MLRILGADELIADDQDDYMRIAARLVEDAAWRTAITERLRTAQPALFGRQEPVRAFADLLIDSN
jgi:protein O-GlcNAc transferase